MSEHSLRNAQEQMRIANVLTEFCRLIDAEDFDAAVLLFEAEAAITTPMFKAVGRQGIKDKLLAGRAHEKLVTRHSWSNLAVTFLGDAEAKVVSHVTTYSGVAPAPLEKMNIMVGVAEDIMRLTEGEWLFADRRLNVLARGQIAMAA
ncbi:nuclear transport factor 2 family protein [Kordiimonas pumila]|uniref:Nuclear transport factor 2 family protein n=1 Tax=Kordiimonas pumila TaxID=2161677 RepID=A0ABV7D5H6_9PROT|nr:nuclear transport factor 2 family protein [Kordiimonas pumila]